MRNLTSSLNTWDHSACRPLRSGVGRHSGGIGVFLSDRISKHVQFVKASDDASYLWFKMHNVVLDCPDIYFCVCYMSQKKDFLDLQKNTPTAICPYECLQKDVLEFQCQGAQILVCGDFNARTAEEPDFLRTGRAAVLPAYCT